MRKKSRQASMHATSIKSTAVRPCLPGRQHHPTPPTHTSLAHGPQMRSAQSKLPTVLVLVALVVTVFSSLSCLVAALPTPGASPSANSTAAGTVIADRYIVVVHDWVTDKVVTDHIASLHAVLSPSSPSSSALDGCHDPATLVSALDLVSVQSGSKTFKGVLGRYSTAVRGYHGELPKSIARALRASRYVKVVEEDRVVRSQVVVNVKTQLLPTWGLDRMSHRARGYFGRYSYIEQAGVNVDVYVVDTGIFIGHPNFGGRASFGASFTGDGNSDVHGHGTHVAGTIGSTTYGVAKRVNLIAVKVLGNRGQVRRPARSVVNMSLGGGGTSTAMNAAIETAGRRGIAFAVAAGNENANACGGSPANSPWVMTAGAMDSTDRRASFSNFGGCLNIFAPGVSVLSTSNAGGTRTLSGTSMASPHVAGQLAILLSVFPSASVLSLYRYMEQTSTQNVLTLLKSGDPNRLLNNALLQGSAAPALAKDAKSAASLDAAADKAPASVSLGDVPASA
ncbi:peptidase S8/S53 domain-containing protein [Entophlyctis helioformis]|nr:peptidase S8/S53 domain-containing protein [Entophlyctis helioformis]